MFIQLTAASRSPIAQCLPGGRAEIAVDGPGIDAAISAGREIDLYKFRIPDQATYTVETSGTTDTFLTLFGPNSQTAEVARDDDSGNFVNCRICMPLAPGEYFAHVRHFTSFGTGAYNLRVRRS